MKKIYQYLPSGILYDTHRSFTEAVKFLECPQTTLWDQLDTGKEYKGFKWYTIPLRTPEQIKESQESLKRILEKSKKSFQEELDRVASENKPQLPKILLFDIETAPMRVGLFNLWNQNVSLPQIISDWFMLSWSAKWLGETNIMSDRLTPEEAKGENDERLVKSLWKLLDECDILVGHNCVEINTPILKQDLTWVKAGDLKLGDKLIGFEEKLKPGGPLRSKGKWTGVHGKERKVLPTEVTGITIEKQHCYKVIFDNGDYVICTDDHYWLAMAEKDRNQRWYKTEKLRVGQRVNKFLTPWEIDKSYEAGWLSGFIAGEGTLKGCSNGKYTSTLSSVDFCQRPTVVLDQAINYCDLLEIPISELKGKKGGLGKGDALYTYTLGGKWKALEVLGKLQIKRLINKINWTTFGGLNGVDSLNSPRRTSTIVSIEDVGIKEVAVFSTTEKTYIANGYPMHNCNRFDVPKANARFIKHNLPPTSPYKQVDTYSIAKNNFGFSSNKLQYLAKYFGIEGKFDTDYKLWAKCIDGDEESLEYMSIYNCHDVEILEQVFLKLRGYAKGLPNMDTYIDEAMPCCPTCGSTKLAIQGDKYFYTQSIQYQLYKCGECGAYSRAKKGNKFMYKKQVSAIPR